MYRFLTILVTLVTLWVGLGIGFFRGQAEETVTTTFIGSTIEDVDQGSQKVTIRTQQGKSWSFQMASADLMNNLHQGDRASLELDDQGRVKKIVKTDDSAQTDPKH